MKICNCPVILLEETLSTNNFLKELCQQENLEEGSIVFTSSQTSGRGQAGNSWESEPGKNLTFSTILFPKEIYAKEQFLLSQLVSLAIADILSEYIPSISIKWPNDIYYSDNKICGILIENELESNLIKSSIIGIGLNVNQTIFKSNAPNPISMKQITGKEYDLFILLEKIICRILRYYDSLSTQKEGIASRYKNQLYHSNGFYMFSDKDGEFSARIINVEPDGFLVLETIHKEIHRYMFKQVSMLIK